MITHQLKMFANPNAQIDLAQPSTNNAPAGMVNFSGQMGESFPSPPPLFSNTSAFQPMIASNEMASDENGQQTADKRKMINTGTKVNPILKC